MSNKRKIRYGIRNRILVYSIGLLVCVLLTALVAISFIVNRYMNEVAIEKYQYISEKMKLELQNCYKESDDLTTELIANTYVQNSLKNSPMKKSDSIALKRTLSYATFANMSNLFYMDNKNNVYTRVANNFNSEAFLISELYENLGSEYSKTKWMWKEDMLYQTGERALFIGRYVRHMEYSHEPGVIMIKMGNSYFKDMLSSIDQEDDVVYLFLDSNYTICYGEMNRDVKDNSETQGEEQFENIRSLIVNEIKESTLQEKEVLYGSYGMIFLCKDLNSGFIACCYVPNSVLNATLSKIQLAIVCIFVAVCGVALSFSFHFSKKITRPVSQINLVMKEFDGTDFTKLLELHTNTELDTIGNTYNQMLNKIEMLLEKIKNQERELRCSELNSLMYQLNPHFLYNTLDNIYMLTRINKDERIMTMIQSLSKLLRIGLSKGKDEITIEEELEHVSCYLDIQKIRNERLFQYEIICDDKLKKRKILKLILQPIVENGIKHGFCEIYEGGIIRIHIMEDMDERKGVACKSLCIKVYNNGRPIEHEVCRQINQMCSDEISNLKNYFDHTTAGYGISNVVSRLRLRYEEKLKFYYETGIGDVAGTTCIIKIPMECCEQDL